MKFVCTFLLLFSILKIADAQNHQVRLGMKNFYYAIEQTDRIGNIEGATLHKNYIPEPLIGYSYNWKKDIWIGLDIGYFEYNIVRSSSSITDSRNSSGESTVDMAITNVDFFIEEMFSYKDNYLFSLGLKIPFQYFNRRIDEQSTTSLFSTQPNSPIEEYGYTKWPQILRTGFFVQQTLSRKLYKDLYFTTKLNMGLSVEKRWGEYDVLNWSRQSGAELSRLEYKVKEEKYTEAQFSIYPSFYLSYFF